MVPAIIVHGGAGNVDEARLDACRAGCVRAADAGWFVLAAGGSALDAAQAAIEQLEADPHFNAGYGAVLNRAGEIEVDAALMTGDLRVGAVGAVPFLRHPIQLARRILEDGEHALLVGAGALEYAAEHGIHPEPAAALVTERARTRLANEHAGRAKPSGTGDTVGACAIDRHGHVAAATSTGGISYKRRGRVGDTPLVGAGTYADDRWGAASATGHGESILRVLMTRFAIERLAAGDDAQAAAGAAVAELGARVHGAGGIILVDKSGRVAEARNTRTMPWASVSGDTRGAGT